MALICNLTGLWLVALLTAHSASVAETLSKKLHVPFPPAFPTRENLDDICCEGHGRPRYPESFYPRSGYSYLRRRGKAINHLESWFTFCCSDQLAKEDDLLVLCCARQAWKQALAEFCTNEFSVMTRAHVCCDSSGRQRWICFNDMSEPSYGATPGYTAPSVPDVSRLNFNKSACGHEREDTWIKK